MFSKILIANRGEIAVRIIETCRRMGIATVVVYSEADADSLAVEMADESVPIGPAPAAQSYLVADKIVEAVRQTGAEAVHPGFRLPVGERGLRASPGRGEDRLHRPEPPRHRGDGRQDRVQEVRHQGRRLGGAGHIGEIDDTAHAIRISEGIGYPVMIKASAGGGGKGIRVAWTRKDVEEGFPAVKAEAKASFGDDRIFHREVHREPAPHRDPGAGR